MSRLQPGRERIVRRFSIAVFVGGFVGAPLLIGTFTLLVLFHSPPLAIVSIVMGFSLVGGVTAGVVGLVLLSSVSRERLW